MLQFLVVLHPCIGRACRRHWKDGKQMVCRQYFFYILKSQLSVAANDINVGILFQQQIDFIRFLVTDGSIQTALPFAGIDNVPKGKAVIKEHFFSDFVICGVFFVKQFKDDLPELVLGMGIVLLHLPGTNSRHRAKNQHFGFPTDNRRKGGDFQMITI